MWRSAGFSSPAFLEWNIPTHAEQSGNLCIRFRRKRAATNLSAEGVSVRRVLHFKEEFVTVNFPFRLGTNNCSCMDTRSGATNSTMKPNVLRFLFTAIIWFAISCTPSQASGTHGGRHSHGGSSRGSPHGGGFHGFGGFHHSSGGHFGRYRSGGGSSSPRGASARPRQLSSTMHRNSAGFTSQPRGNSSSFGVRPTNSNRPPASSSTFRGWPQQAHNISAREPNRGNSFANSDRPPSARSNLRSSYDRGYSGSANRPTSAYSFNGNRPPAAQSNSRNQSPRGNTNSANPVRSAYSSNPNRPPNMQSNPNSQRPRPAGTFRPGYSADFGHAPSNRTNARPNRSSSSDWLFRANASQFQSSRFSGLDHSHWGGGYFDRNDSFGIGEFSVVPDLFGLALDVGTFWLRGLNLLGLGIGALDLASYGVNSIGSLADPQSQNWGLGLAPRQAENPSSPQ